MKHLLTVTLLFTAALSYSQIEVGLITDPDCPGEIYVCWSEPGTEDITYTTLFTIPASGPITTASNRLNSLGLTSQDLEIVYDQECRTIYMIKPK